MPSFQPIPGALYNFPHAHNVGAEFVVQLRRLFHERIPVGPPKDLIDIPAWQNIRKQVGPFRCARVSRVASVPAKNYAANS